MSSLSRVIRDAALCQSGPCIVGLAAQETKDVKPSRAEIAALQARIAAMLQEARAKAAEIVAKAYSERDEVLRQAREEGLRTGFQAGYQDGLAQAEAQNKELVGQLLALVDSAQGEIERLLRDTEPQLIDLAFTIARRIIQAELSLRPELVTEIVAAAIEEARGNGSRLIRVHPEDARLLEQYLPQAAIEAGGNQWAIRADPSLKRGDCIIETGAGIVDACIETQLAELYKLLRGEPSNGRADD